jgi:hypothetical protein
MTIVLCFSAMQKKPEGESRIPTDMWAGMGFSKSMPESAIREKLGQLGIGTRYEEDDSLPATAEIPEVRLANFPCLSSFSRKTYGKFGRNITNRFQEKFRRLSGRLTDRRTNRHSM